MTAQQLSVWASPREASAGPRTRARALTATLLAGAALAFLLPFGTVSCDGETVSFTGVELATFAVEPDPGSADGGLASDIEGRGSALALLALSCAIAGCASAVVRGRGGAFATVGVLALFGALWNSGLADVETHAGFELAVTAFAAAAAARVVARLVARRRRGARVWPYLVAAAPAGVLLLIAAIVVAEAIGSSGSGY